MADQQMTTDVLEPCPLCSCKAAVKDHRISGAHSAAWHPTPHPYVECTNCGLRLPPVPCDDSLYGRKVGAKSYIEARAEAEMRWNHRPVAWGGIMSGLPLPSVAQKLGIVGAVLLGDECQLSLASGESVTAPAAVGQWLIAEAHSS